MKKSKTIKLKLTSHFRGVNGNEFPLAAVAYYGPDNITATKVVVAIVTADQKIVRSENWTIDEGDIREDTEINHRVVEFIKNSEAVRAIITEKILGCPHTPGEDFPEGDDCPYCPYWILVNN